MYRYFQSYDFNSEIEKEILRSNHLVQVLIDEFGFLRLKKNLLEKLEDGLSVEIILLCPNDKKSIKMVNLAKKITDLNGEIYFVNNEDLLKKNDFFGIFDKVYLISKKNYDKDISNETYFLAILMFYLNQIKRLSKEKKHSSFHGKLRIRMKLRLIIKLD